MANVRGKKKKDGRLLAGAHIENLTRAATMQECEEKSGQRIKQRKDSGEGGGGQQGGSLCRESGL